METQARNWKHKGATAENPKDKSKVLKKKAKKSAADKHSVNYNDSQNVLDAR